MSARPLTPRQAEVLAYIRARVAEYGAPPSLREMAVFMGASSTNGARDCLLALERKGALVRFAGGRKARSVRLAGPMPPIDAGHGYSVRDSRGDEVAWFADDATAREFWPCVPDSVRCVDVATGRALGAEAAE